MKIVAILILTLGSMQIFAAGRDYAIQLEAQMTETETEFSPGTTGTVDTVQLTVAGKRNLGRFEYGGFLSYGSVDGGGADSDSYQVGLLGDINFIENNSAQMVPYLGLRASYIGGEVGSEDLSGFGYGAEVGLKLFVSGGLAVTLAYGLRIEDATIESSPEVDRKTTVTGLEVGLAYYF